MSCWKDKLVLAKPHRWLPLAAR